MNHWNPTVDRSTDEEDKSETETNSAAKRGTVAAGALVVGSAALTNEKTTTAEDASETDEATDLPQSDEECSQDDQLVLVSLADYWPGLTVRVVDRLPVPIAVQLLRLPNDETVPVLTRPDEYAGYVVRAESGDEQVYSTMFVFTRGSLEPGVEYEFGTDAQMFSTQLNLFRVTASRADSQAEDEDDAEESDAETADESNGTGADD